MISNYILIIGAMKSGTTTLHDYLIQHPEIVGGLEKEVNFFSSEEKWERGFGWYEAQFDYNSERHRYALDASTDYTKHPFCAGVTDRLKASTPRQFKLIYIMRHPLRRIESQASHAELTGTEIAGVSSSRRTHSFHAGISLAAVAPSLYAYQIDRFSEYYDDGQLLLLTLEELAREPRVVLEKVYTFLEIDKPFVVDNVLRSNTMVSHQTPHRLWYLAYNRPIVRSIIKAIAPKKLREEVYKKAIFLAQPRGRFTLNAEEERVLTTLITPDLLRLRERYNVDAEKEWGIKLSGENLSI